MKARHLLFALLSAQVPHAADFHVAPTGIDTNDGSLRAPMVTIQCALGKVRTRKASYPDEPNRIILHGGEYVLAKTILVTQEDSGVAGKPLEIVAAEGETPVITSARRITGWKTAPSDTPGLAPEVRGQVKVADIPKGWRFHFLHADGEPMQVARMVKTNQWRSWPKPTAVGPVERAGQKLSFTPGLLDQLPANGDLEINLMPVEYWNTISVLRDLSPSESTARRHSKSPTTFWKDNFHGFGNFNLLNALKFLTEPGEWCVDSAAGKLYFLPPAGISVENRIEAPSLYRLLEIRGTADKPVRHVVIRGLKFHFTDRLPEDQWPSDWVMRQAELPDAAVFFENSEDCAFEDNSITWSGSYGIALEKHAQRIRVVHNDIAHPGCGGVLLQGYGPGTTDVNKDNVIQRNHIHHTGNGGYLHSAAVTLYQSGGNDIAYNWISDVPYVGIQIAGAGWAEYGSGKPLGAWDSYGDFQAMYQSRWDELPGGSGGKFTRESFKTYLHSRNNLIRNNILTEYLKTLSDGGALYSWGCGTGNQWEGNLLRRIRRNSGERWCFALYMDDYVDGATLANNVAWHAGDSTINKGSNRWDNNLIQSDKPEWFDKHAATIVAEARRAGGIPGVSTVADILKLPPDPVAMLPVKRIVPGEWIEATNAVQLYGPRPDDKRTYLGWIEGGHRAAFGPYLINPTLIKGIEIEVGVDPKFAGGKIHVRTSPDGPDYACFRVESTGGFESWKTISAPLALHEGVHPIYLVFEGGQAVCSVKRLRFLQSAPAPSQ